MVRNVMSHDGLSNGDVVVHNESDFKFLEAEISFDAIFYLHIFFTISRGHNVTSFY